ncbi:EAL domain-containing protein [Thalassotalea sp. ND16A]|uniref:EAL domain-containing protein n=1 Tax=Thalassotalea sp. ND16A TaxID=1535422 RepID=UPI0013640B98|nr:EAL domain-containing protein [Thalassotalea sp. ND16A]
MSKTINQVKIKQMMPLNSLKSRITLLFILLLIAVQAVSFIATHSSNERLENQQLKSQLTQAETLLKNEIKKSNYYLTAFAVTVAKDYGLKQMLGEDTRSLLVALNNHRQRIDADISFAFNQQRVVIGELLVKEPNEKNKKITMGEQINTEFSHPQWLTNEPVSVYYQLNESVYQLVIAPINSGDMVVGHIAFGYLINDRLARTISDSTDFSVGFGLSGNSTWHWLALHDTEAETTNSSIEQTDFSPLLSNISQTYMFANHPLGTVDGLKLSATTFQLRSNLTAAIKKDGSQILLLISITMLLSLLGAYIIAISLTAPLRQLVLFSSNIAKGDYHSKITVGSTEELNKLALQFEKMQQAIKDREDAITKQAYQDSLTQLPNRNQFHRDMMDIGHPFLLCQLSIRRLANINDTLGHDVGDQVILEVTKRLKTLEIPLYQVSGNVLLLRWDNETNIKLCVNQINSVIEPIFSYQNIALHLQINIGLTESEGSPQADQLLKEVDSAMQISKRKNLLYQLYNRQIDFNTLDRLQLINRLKSAIENDEFTLHYQPKLNLKTSTVEGVEALVRWEHPVNGLIHPDTFIHIAEQTGQMNALSLWGIDKAIEQYFIWQAKGIKLQIAVNISPQNLLNENFCNLLINKLCGSEKLHQAITLEITEDAFLDHSSKAAENITLLRNKGIYLSIDDYGTGYSTLAQLRNLPVEELKIDRCFIQNLTQHGVDQLIVSSTIKLAHRLNLTVVAEGVEDQQTQEWLIEQGCEKAQGYFISRPLSARDFDSWLTKSSYSCNYITS